MIAVLGSHFGLMWRAKDSANKGIAQDSLGEALGAHPYAARKALEQSRRWTFPARAGHTFAVRMLMNP